MASQEQTAEFFTGAFVQYEGVHDSAADIRVVAATGHSIWADVTWTHDTGATGAHDLPARRHRAGWRIAVLTPILD